MQKYIDFHTCPPVPLVVAHRGARGHAPENTLTAAALGYAVQADLWELDANYTKDGKLVVMHDDTLVRTTDVETAFPGRLLSRMRFHAGRDQEPRRRIMVRRARSVRPRRRRGDRRRHAEKL